MPPLRYVPDQNLQPCDHLLTSAGLEPLGHVPSHEHLISSKYYLSAVSRFLPTDVTAICQMFDFRCDTWAAWHMSDPPSAQRAGCWLKRTQKCAALASECCWFVCIITEVSPCNALNRFNRTQTVTVRSRFTATIRLRSILNKRNSRCYKSQQQKL